MECFAMDRLSLAFVGVWSSGYVFAALATQDAAPLAVTFWRLLLAAGLLAALTVRRGVVWPHDARTVGGIALVGALLFSVPFGTVYLAIGDGLPAGTAALIISCCPLVVAAAQGLLGVERLARRQWFGAALGMVGVVLALLSRTGRPASFVPVLWTVVGLLAFAAATVLTARLIPPGVDARAVGAIENLCAAVLLIPLALADGGIAVPLTAHNVGSAAWLTIVNGVGGPLLIVALVRRHGPTKASSLQFLVPPVTALVSWPLLGQPIGVLTVAGLAVAGVGVTLVRNPRAGRLLRWVGDRNLRSFNVERRHKGRLVPATVPARAAGRRPGRR
jgi:drug/metabolite transporter (DMT)-like permease